MKPRTFGFLFEAVHLCSSDPRGFRVRPGADQGAQERLRRVRILPSVERERTKSVGNKGERGWITRDLLKEARKLHGSQRTMDAQEAPQAYQEGDHRLHEQLEVSAKA